eukprot:TRINITY_DN2483_c0_g5_i1.p1 TRINITY_DN2483_c0_g5~~TRINITY_DN2483_c0_g5_i1.p1  ORF type:complete len:245 (-),score=6.85 TRINITY_DN2483_c0_g5_i1:28-666(-)
MAEEDNWRWCYKCQGLYFAEIGSGVCPAAKIHSPVSSDRKLYSHKRRRSEGKIQNTRKLVCLFQVRSSLASIQFIKGSMSRWRWSRNSWWVSSFVYFNPNFCITKNKKQKQGTQTSNISCLVMIWLLLDSMTGNFVTSVSAFILQALILPKANAQREDLTSHLNRPMTIPYWSTLNQFLPTCAFVFSFLTTTHRAMNYCMTIRGQSVKYNEY